MTTNGNPSELAQPFSALIDQVNMWWEAVGPILATAFNEMMGTIDVWYGLVYDAYLEAGAPYGESQGGCMRWLRERAEAEALVRQAEDILYHHELLAHMRALHAIGQRGL